MKRYRREPSSSPVCLIKRTSPAGATENGPKVLTDVTRGTGCSVCIGNAECNDTKAAAADRPSTLATSASHSAV